MSVVTVHMVYFCAFARSEILLENARKSGVGRGQFDAGVNGLSFETSGNLPRREKILAKAANVPPTPCLKKKRQTTVEVQLSSFI